MKELSELMGKNEIVVSFDDFRNAEDDVKAFVNKHNPGSAKICRVWRVK